MASGFLTVFVLQGKLRRIVEVLSLKCDFSTVFINFATPFTFHTAGSCFEKEFNASNFKLTCQSDIPLRPDGAACGEDDFFITQKHHIRFMNVADGAGGWQDKGIDTKLFIADFLDVIEEKCRGMSEELARQHDAAGNRILLKFVEDSLKEVEAVTENVHFGSGTMAFMSLNLKTLNANCYHLGDAGYLVIRDQRASKIVKI